MPDDLKSTRTELVGTTRSLDRIDETIRRRTVVFAVVGLIMAAVVTLALLYVGIGVRDNRDDIDAARAGELRDDIERCERSNETAETARLVVRWQYEDYNLVAANQTPERQQFLENRLGQRMAALDELKPFQDCDKLPRPQRN